MAEAGGKWKGTTFGGPKLLGALIFTLRWMPAWMIYVFSGVFVVPVCMIVNASGRISYRLYRKRFGFSRLKSLYWDYRNHFRFAQIIIDRFAMYGGKRFKIESKDQETFDSLARQPEGFVQLSAHIGNYELAGYSLVAKTKVFNALVFGGEVSTVMTNRMSLFSPNNINMISTKEDMSHLFEINNALSRGEIMSMPGDRIFGSPRGVTVKFLGADATFPYGPFSVARSRGNAVIAVNVVKSSINGYRIFVTPIDYDREATAREQIKQIAQGYVAELERVVRQYPDQWFNFYNFWND